MNPWTILYRDKHGNVTRIPITDPRVAHTYYAKCYRYHEQQEAMKAAKAMG